MKITSVKVKLTEEDILENIKQYVKVDNFKVESIIFDDKINIACTYIKGIKITLKVKIQIDKVSQNILYLNIIDVNIAKVHVLNSIKNLALKNILKGFEKFGVLISKDTISVDMGKVCNQIPLIKFKLTSLNILMGAIEAEVKDLIVSQEDEVLEVIEKVEEIIPSEKAVFFGKTEDKYTKLRTKILKKIPDKYINLSEYIFLVPDILILFGRLLKDKRVSVQNKVVIGSIVAYFASPIDLSMIFIPFVGGISAIALVFYGLSYVYEKLPEQIIIENWQGKESFALKIKGVIEILNKASGGGNIDKLINFSKITSIKKLSNK